MSAVEVLAAHRYRGLGVSDARVTGCCWCGWKGTDHAAHVLAALTAAGHTVVELPEPDRTDGPGDLTPPTSTATLLAAARAAEAGR